MSAGNYWGIATRGITATPLGCDRSPQQAGYFPVLFRGVSLTQEGLKQVTAHVASLTKTSVNRNYNRLRVRCTCGYILSRSLHKTAKCKDRVEILRYAKSSEA